MEGDDVSLRCTAEKRWELGHFTSVVTVCSGSGGLGAKYRCTSRLLFETMGA